MHWKQKQVTWLHRLLVTAGYVELITSCVILQQLNWVKVFDWNERSAWCFWLQLNDSVRPKYWDSPQTHAVVVSNQFTFQGTCLQSRITQSCLFFFRYGILTASVLGKQNYVSYVLFHTGRICTAIKYNTIFMLINIVFQFVDFSHVAEPLHIITSETLKCFLNLMMLPTCCQLTQIVAKHSYSPFLLGPLTFPRQVDSINFNYFFLKMCIFSC